MDTDQVVIKVDKVYKNFILPHEKSGSVKGIFTSMFREATKEKETQKALVDISFEVKSGEFFGIVGRNGSGKSTLLKMLAGIYQPTKGKISTYGKLVPFIELGVGFNPELSGRDNVYLNGAVLGFSTKEVDAMYDEIVAFAELERFMDQKLKNYSSGMQVRLAFSMAIRANADILLIDEVLAVGDADFQRKCYEYFKSLKKNKKTVVFVSHDMEAVREYCDRVLLIEQSKLVMIGSASRVTPEYSKLFMNKTEHSDNTDEQDTRRWGNGSVKITKANTKVDEEYITVKSFATSFKDIDTLQFGLHVTGSDGGDITAVNNRMINAPDIKMLKKNTKIEFRWKILNIFSDGNYTITLTLVDGSGEVLDWRYDLNSFEVKRTIHSSTSVLPPISLETIVNDVDNV